ncbi:MAG TPA: hypothetical protein VGM39_18730 [Kofleriaceae bacterium]|jgi:hypothetical protein
MGRALSISVAVAMGACGSSKPVEAPPTVAVADPARDAREEQARRAKLVEAHHALEAEQSEALAWKCEKDQPEPHERCEPSCYRAETADPRAKKKLPRAEIMHLACTAHGSDDVMLLDELGGAKLVAKPARGRAKPHKKGWEADVEAKVIAALGPEVARGDVVKVTGTWSPRSQPLTNERLRCVTVSHFTAMKRPLDDCGARGGVACEAMGHPAPHALDVVHFRLAEARAMQAAGDHDTCQRAALEAIAVSRGLPRWRQYVALNINAWRSYPRYRTRFDGWLDEDALFATAAKLGEDALAQYQACGGDPNPKTPVEQEQSFHRCW